MLQRPCTDAVAKNQFKNCSLNFSPILCVFSFRGKIQTFCLWMCCCNHFQQELQKPVQVLQEAEQIAHGFSADADGTLVPNLSQIEACVF